MLILVFKYNVFIFASIDIVRQCFLWIPSTILYVLESKILFQYCQNITNTAICLNLVIQTCVCGSNGQHSDKAIFISLEFLNQCLASICSCATIDSNERDFLFINKHVHNREYSKCCLSIAKGCRYKYVDNLKEALQMGGK